MNEITQDKINARAVKIAAKIMQQVGLCRYASASNCRKVYTPSTADCAGCIKRFLLGEAKKQLEKEEKRNEQTHSKEKGAAEHRKSNI